MATLVAVADPINYAVNLTVTGATGAITVTRYVQGASPTGTLVRGSFANGRTVPDRDAPIGVDIVYIARDTVGESTQQTVRLESDTAVLNVMSDPTLQAAPILLADENQSYEGRSTAHAVIGSNAPLVTVQPPTYRSGTFRMLCPSWDDWAALRAVHLSGGVLLLRTPCQSEIPDTAFIMIAARNTLPWNAPPPRHRIHELDYQAVAPDATPPVEFAWTYDDVPGEFATYDAIPLAVSTYNDLASHLPEPTLGF